MHSVIEAKKLPEMRWFNEDEESSADDDSDDAIAENDLEVQSVEVSEGNKVSFVDFLDHLVNGAKTYSEIVLAKTGVPKLDRHLRNLRLIKANQSYGFLMALRMGGCTDNNFVKVIKLTEAFLMRRHICRKRGNDNESAFARSCVANPLNPIPEVDLLHNYLCKFVMAAMRLSRSPKRFLRFL